MGTGAAGFRRLVSAFHDVSKKLSPCEIRETNDYLKLFTHIQSLSTLFFVWLDEKSDKFWQPVDKFLIKCSIACL
jgi:hypothetical protein